MVTGTTSEKAATPMTGTRTRRITSVAYAEDDRLSEANTARAVGLPSRSWASSSVCKGAPRSRFFNRYLVLSGTVSRGGVERAASLACGRTGADTSTVEGPDDSTTVTARV